MKMTVRWPQEDRIRWVECRHQERIRAEQQKQEDRNNFDRDFERELDTDDIPDRLSLEVWLSKERDHLSWQQIAIKFFSEIPPAQRKTAGISKARRAHALVDRRLEPAAKDALRRYLDACIEDLFHCTPQDFKRYLDSINTRKPRK